MSDPAAGVLRRAVLLNGPPRSGKDTAAKALCKAVEAVRVGFADHLKEAVHAAYGVDALYDGFEDVKDEPSSEFFGLSPRQAYIAHSERYMKVLHGADVFGRLWLRRARVLAGLRGVDTAVVPDSGFPEEAGVVIDALGAENVLLIRLHRDGHDFRGDSRGYIELPGIRTWDVANVTANSLSRSVARIVFGAWL